MSQHDRAAFTGSIRCDTIFPAKGEKQSCHRNSIFCCWERSPLDVCSTAGGKAVRDASNAKRPSGTAIGTVQHAVRLFAALMSHSFIQRRRSDLADLFPLHNSQRNQLSSLQQRSSARATNCRVPCPGRSPPSFNLAEKAKRSIVYVQE